MNNCLLLCIVFASNALLVSTKKFKDNEKPDWAKKDIRDYSDADLERLLDQWEVNNADVILNMCFYNALKSDYYQYNCLSIQSL